MSSESDPVTSESDAVSSESGPMLCESRAVSYEMVQCHLKVILVT